MNLFKIIKNDEALLDNTKIYRTLLIKIHVQTICTCLHRYLYVFVHVTYS